MRKFLIFSFLVPIGMLCGNPFVPCASCPGDFSFDAEWIYFSPTSESRYFAAETTTIPAALNIGTRKASPFDNFFSGYRLGAAYALCDCDRYLSVTWTSLRARKDFTVTSGTALGTPPFITNIDGFGLAAPGNRASIIERFRYYAVDGVLGQKALCTPCLNMDLLAGIHYAHLINNNHQVFFTNVGIDSLLIDIQNSFWGIGPELGLHADAPLWCNLSLVGDLTTACIIGKPSSFTNSVFASGFTFSSFNNQRRWRLVPYLNIGLGFNYCFSWESITNCVCPSGLRGSIALKYEAISYFDGLGSIMGSFTGNSASTIDLYRNVTMHGPSLSFALSF